MAETTAKYQRVVLKLSGEALAGAAGFGLDLAKVETIASQVKTLSDLGVEVSVVVGGGNFWRGVKGESQGMDRATSDYMGMLATVMNCMALQERLERLGLDTRLMTAIDMRADAILMAKQGTDGVYDSDPNENPDAIRYEQLDYMELIQKRLKVMDATGTTLCMDNRIPLIVFDLDVYGNIERAVKGEKVGTFVGRE